MRALLKAAAGPGVELAEVPEPLAGDADVTIRVLRTGICGTDLHIESWDQWASESVAPPLVPGHEFSGEVVSVGRAVRDVHVGAVVSGEGHVVCGTCRNCRAGRRHMCNRTSSLGVNRNGAFAEYVVLPESNVWVHPAELDLDLAAIFDPLGNAVHTALKFPLVGEDVLICGAGPIGLMAAAVVRHIGARFVVVTDVSQARLDLARRVGADLAVNVSTQRVADAQVELGMREGFDANGGVFEALFGPDDAIISDELNHASLIDGIRLCKARRLRYRNRDLGDLEEQLKAASAARQRIIVTDGVFSMDGYLAPLPGICDLAERYGALVLVDDSHAVGFMGERGRGTPELMNVQGRVDIYTGTFGKALGGASGGYVAGHKEIISMLRQRARPYLFSNTVAPAVVAGTLTALDLIEQGGELRRTLVDNAALFRVLMADAGFDLLPGQHPIVPVMFGDAALAAQVAERMLAHGVYVVAFSYPVVPIGKARIRVQPSAAHSEGEIRRCVQAFIASREECEGAVGATPPA